MKLHLFLLTCYCALALASLESDRQLFEDFMGRYGRYYLDESDYEYRFSVFRGNLVRMEELASSNPHAVFGINQFSDLTTEEFIDQYTGVREETYTVPQSTTPYVMRNNAPRSLDWVARGMVAPVQNQGRCGSCWAFAAANSVESMRAVQGGWGLDLRSVQQYVDCVRKSNGCSGGWPHHCWEWNMDNVLMSWSAYPYTGRQGSCRRAGGAIIGGYTMLSQHSWTSASNDAIMDALFNLGPLTITLNADSLQHYRSGILTNHRDCSGTSNHAVNIVGYGSASVPFWKVRNSWGAHWGESGYFRIERSTRRGGLCSMNRYVGTACRRANC